MPNTFEFPQGQKFDCRDCPARCCRNWDIAVTQEEAARYEADAWVAERFKKASVSLIRNATSISLPMVVKNKAAQCVFLDEDDRCSMHKQYGHSYLPKTCQLFPFGFLELQNGSVSVALSHLCPSIRDNYGDPIEERLETKFHDSQGRITQLTPTLNIGENLSLNPEQYLKLAQFWREKIALSGSLPQCIADLYDFTVQFGAALENTGADAFESTLNASREYYDFGEDLERTEQSPLIARVLMALVLMPISHPSSVMAALPSDKSRKAGLNPMELPFSFVNLLLGRGETKLLFLQSFEYSQTFQVSRFLGAGKFEDTIREYLLAVLDRKHLFTKHADLTDLIFTLGLAVSLISHYARCSAASRGQTEVNLADVKEGISIADLRLLLHGDLLSKAALYSKLIHLLSRNRLSARRMLASELAPYQG